MDCRGAVETGSGASPAANRFIILILAVSERQVVHCTLAGCQHAQRAIERIGYRLGGLNVAAHDSCRRLRGQHRPFWHDNPDRFQAAIIEWNIFFDQGSKYVEYGCPDNGRGRIEVVWLLCRGTAEINCRLPRRGVDLNPNMDLGAKIHALNKCPGLQTVDHAAHLLGSVRPDMLHVSLYNSNTELLRHLPEFPCAFFVGGDLRTDVADILSNIAGWILRTAHQLCKSRFQEHTVLYEKEISDQDPLLVNRSARRRH